MSTAWVGVKMTIGLADKFTSTITLTNTAPFSLGGWVVISKGYPHPDWFFWRIWQDGDRVIFKWVYRVLGWPLDPEYRIYDMTNTQLTLEAR